MVRGGWGQQSRTGKGAHFSSPPPRPLGKGRTWRGEGGKLAWSPQVEAEDGRVQGQERGLFLQLFSTFLW